MSSILRTQARAAGRWTRKNPRRYTPVRSRSVQRAEVASKAALLREATAAGRSFTPFMQRRNSLVAAVMALLSRPTGARGR